ncbi:hypothetical protein BCIN_04g02680 [Botrytis cinerea B05.10]|uniref:Major facilitator superfamily (MFS) profile domain-containing protein n=2 Tax=Botryotinia fuckeliana TaxID=40559 RepID=A0A384JFJ3_BOTFB|nr:hypothetical protein BCIN_04g02680 [Botrytis cinerea B05.10]ATZ49074.1 hypothetical protein BCIN_04g02680 [Botrytis cinerea B05.10]
MHDTKCQRLFQSFPTRLTSKIMDDSIHKRESSPSGEPISESKPNTRQTGPNIPRWRLVCLCISLCFGLFLALLDTSIVATALYTIGVEFNSLNSVSWVALAYTLSYLGCAVLFARIGDIAGRKNAYIAAFIIFFAFSIACGFAKTLNQLIAFRALQGIGGSGLYSLTMVIFPEISPPGMRRWIGSLAGAVVAMSGVLGPVIGGIITRYASWRWIFWINAPIGIVPLILFYLVWPNETQLHQSKRRPLRQLDLVGAFILIIASILFVFAFQEAGLEANSWNKPLFLIPLIVGIVFWILLFSWEFTVQRKWEEKLATMFPWRLIQNRVYMFGLGTTLLMGFPYFVVIYSLPLRFQVVNGKSPLAAGLGLLPMLGSTAVASFLGGMLNGTKNRVFFTLLAGSGLSAIGTSSLSTLSNTEYVEAKTYGFLVFVGLGFGLTVSTVSMLSNYESSIRDHAVAQGITSQARILGGSIGIAASTAILSLAQQTQLTGIVSPEQLASLETSAKSMTYAQLHAVRQAYSDSFSEDMKVCAIVAGVCVLVTIGTWKKNPVTIEQRFREQIEEEVQRAKGEAMVSEEPKS